jgi:mono/diheme cytochrome c family protein
VKTLEGALVRLLDYSAHAGEPEIAGSVPLIPMKRSYTDQLAPAYFALLTIGTISVLSADGFGATLDGKTILEKHCGRCHSIEPTGPSPLNKAPPLREIYLKYPIEQLESGLAEGMGSRHRKMPQLQFSSEEISAMLNYLGTITGVDYSKQPRVIAPGETIPP